jgi:hypothetical protein
MLENVVNHKEPYLKKNEHTGGRYHQESDLFVYGRGPITGIPQPR